jgi:uncharacterized membrane protein
MNRTWDDHRVEATIGTILRWGVILAASVVQAGGIWYLIRHGGDAPNYSVFHGEPSSLNSLSGILHGMMAGQSRALIQFGLLILIATPVARVAYTLAAFVLRRDHAYMAITSIVLAVLIYSLTGGG